MEFSVLLNHLGDKVGIPDLAPEDDGSCRLCFDDMIIDMKPTGDEKHILLFGEIAVLPLERKEELLEQILSGNFLFSATLGAALGLDVSSQILYLQQQEALDILDDEAFEKLIENFVNTIESWKRLLNDFQQSAAAVPNDDAAQEDESISLSASAGFFRA